MRVWKVEVGFGYRTAAFVLRWGRGLGTKPGGEAAGKKVGFRVSWSGGGGIVAEWESGTAMVGLR